MFKFILIFLIIQQVYSTDEQTHSLSKHPLFIKIFRLLDQLLLQVHEMQILIIRTYDMINELPYDLRPFYSECVNETNNVSKIHYSSNLNEAARIRIPQIKSQLKQATTIEQQLNIMNITDRIVADISLNTIKPSFSLITEILDCFKSKSKLTMV
ncbi:unnamed protein product [Adineta steineri]|uniref:Uncharacterized protein n=1 Tax=Adineta steineri TaxID=433720 RepID=A0A814W0B1_9BILA|nr:unnamed protein product [Adineta steineri]CAF3624721.1 unnamed protein product [Adineta steineri]